MNLSKRSKDKELFSREQSSKENTNYSILLVSHKGIINKIKNMYFTKTDMDDEFPMGHFEIYNL